MKKNVFLIVPSLAIGGQERIAVQTAALLQAEYDVKVVVFERTAQEYPCPVPVINLNLPASPILPVKLVRVLRRNAALRKLKRQSGAAVAYSFGDIANASNALSRAGERTFLSVHGYGSVPKSRAAAAAYRLLCRRAAATFCVSAQIAREMQKATGLCAEKFVTLYNPYDIAALQAEAQTPQVLPHPCIVAVGRLEPVKGYDNLLGAFRQVHEACPPATLVLVGDGSCRTALEKNTAQLGLGDAVCFAGMQQNPVPWMAGADLFVLSSHSEGFPNAMIEAMACGLPVVSLDCPTGPREILMPERATPVSGCTETACGVLCPAIPADCSPQEKAEKQARLAEGLLSLLTDKARREQCGLAAKRRAGDFDAAHYAGALRALF